MITLSGIEKRRSKDFCLTCDNLLIEENKIYVLHGKNGSGKSTFLRIISGISECDAGKILVDGKKLSPGSPDICGFLGVERMMDFLTPKEYFLLVGKSYDLPKQKIEENYGLVNSYFGKNYWDESKFIHQLSDGNKILVGIYASFIPCAKYVYLDEPFNYLDEDSTEKLISFLSCYVSFSGNTVIVSDNSGKSEGMSSDVIAIKDGKVSLAQN